MMKTIERIIEMIILALCFLLIVLPEIIYCGYFEIRDWVYKILRG